MKDYTNICKNTIRTWYKNQYKNSVYKKKNISKFACKKFILETVLLNCSKHNYAKALNIFNTHYEKIRRETYTKNKRFSKSQKVKEILSCNQDIQIERALRFLYHCEYLELKRENLNNFSKALRLAIEDNQERKLTNE